MTSPLQINRYDRLIRRLTGIVGEGAIATGVLPDIFPVINVEGLETDGWALAGWKPAMGGAVISGAAGERPHIQIANPAGSGVITVVETAIFATNSTSTILFNIHDALLATITVASRWRDRRFATLSRPVTQVRQENLVGTPIVSPILAADLLTRVSILWEPPKGTFVLVPGTAFAFTSLTPQTQMSITFFWRERPIEPAESNI